MDRGVVIGRVGVVVVCCEVGGVGGVGGVGRVPETIVRCTVVECVEKAHAGVGDDQYVDHQRVCEHRPRYVVVQIGHRRQVVQLEELVVDSLLVDCLLVCSFVLVCE